MSSLLTWEELPEWPRVSLGLIEVPYGEMVAFAERWDPQPFHLGPVDDDSVRGETPIASGVYSYALLHRRAIEVVYSSWAVIAGRVIRDLRFLRPVTAGMTLGASLAVTEKYATRPDRGIVVTHGVLADGQSDVLSVTTEVVVRRR